VLTTARDSMDDLRREGTTRRLSAADYHARLSALRQQQVAAENQLAKAEEQVAVIAEIEADPVAWFDSLSERVPSMMRNFPW
jgi:hypothetical protein